MVEFNLDLLETNVINLSVVIGLLIYVGGDALRAVLEARKETIYKRLIDLRAEVEADMVARSTAQKQFEAAKEKVLRLQTDSRLKFISRLAVLIKQTQDEKKRFKEAKKVILQMEEKRISKSLSLECSRQALVKAKEKVSKRLATNVQQHRLIGNSLFVLNKLV